MRLAPIAAPQWAFRYHSGDYHMVHIPWAFKVPGTAQYYAQSERDDSIWVMANGGTSGIETLARGAAILRADEVVLPNCARDGATTLKQAWIAAQGLPDIKSVMFVPQGKDLTEWRQCLEAWLRNWEKQQLNCQLTIGLCGGETMARKEQILAANKYDYAIHLLGVPNLQTFLRQDLPLCKSCVIRGVDTSLPFVLGAKGFLLSPLSEKQPLEDPIHYTRLNAWNMRLIDLNIRILRGWLEEGRASHYFPMTLPRIVASRWATPLTSTRSIYEDPEVALRLAGCPVGYYEWSSEGVRALAPGQPLIRDTKRLTVARPRK